MKLIGNIDSIKNGHIIGWYADQENLSASLQLEIEINGLHCLQVKANKLRSDVKNAGIGNGRYGFDIDLSKWTDFPGEYKVEITLNPDKTPLPGTPIHVSSAGQYSLDTTELIYSQQPLPSGAFMSVAAPRKIARSDCLQKISIALAENRQVVVLPPFIDWNIALFQRPQHIARAMAKAGTLVIYCTGGHHDTSDGYYELEPNLLWTNQFDDIEPELTGVWFELYSTNPFPDHDRLTRWKKNGNRILYEYVDHIDETISGTYTNRLYSIFDSLNSDLIDLFVATAKNLYDELVDRFGKDKVVLSPNGVDVDHFTQNVRPAESIEKIMALGKPIVGYFGALARWLDYDLMLQLAEARKDLSFVYIGPEYDLDRDLPVAPNMFWLGKVDYSELPKFGRFFDLCFIPFKEGRIAETTSPLKLFEYFALQKPVVVTSWMAECVAFKEVLHGSDVAEVSSVITSALAVRNNEKFRDLLMQQALKNSWANRALTMINGMTQPAHALPPSITVRVNSGVAIASGNYDHPYREVAALFIPKNKNGEVIFGFGCNDLEKGDYVSMSIPAPQEIPVFSIRTALLRKSAPISMEAPGLVA
ncbi:glycosyltransferase, partial [Massilia timonae]|uniref:glycosyltransferase n=1 Tax=Massilia timonae TaxID=47229 RepID=UPI00289D9452